MEWLVLAIVAALAYLGFRSIMSGHEPPDIRPGDRVRALSVRNAVLPPEADLSPFVEGIVVTADTATQVLVVKDDDGSWDCFLTGAVLLERPATAPLSEDPADSWLKSREAGEGR